MDTSAWNQEAALEWHYTFSELNFLHASQFSSVTDMAERLKDLNDRLARLSRGSRLTNAQINSRFLTLCSQSGYEEMVRDVTLKEGKYLFTDDQRSWTSFDELVARFVEFESWQRSGQDGALRTMSNEQRPRREASLQKGMQNVSLGSRQQQSPPSWQQSAPAYTDDPYSDYYQQEQKPSIPEKRPDVQKRPLQRSGTQRAFDFMARQSQMPQVPTTSHDPMPDPEDLAPPPSLLSPRDIKDKRASRKSMRYDTEAFMS